MAVNRPMHTCKRTALITGIGGHGIGRSIALTLARQGMAIAGIHRRKDDGAERLMDALESRGATACAMRCDVNDPAACRELVADIHARLGPIDILIANAGGDWFAQDPDSLEAITFLRTVADELASLVNLVPLILPHMRQRQWGRIVAITGGEAAPLADPLALPYLVGKRARSALIDLMGSSLLTDGITANVVSPGGPGMIRPYASLEAAIAAMEYGNGDRDRLAEPQDVAEAVSFLCSPAARWTTGATIPIMATSLPAGEAATDACG